MFEVSSRTIYRDIDAISRAELPVRSVPDGGEYYLVTYPFIERDYYCDQLLNFGSRCECLSPAHVREALRRRVRALAALYGA